MNIQQIKDDLDAGIMVSKPMLVKLAEAALIYEQWLTAIARNGGTSDAAQWADDALDEVKEM